MPPLELRIAALVAISMRILLATQDAMGAEWQAPPLWLYGIEMRGEGTCKNSPVIEDNIADQLEQLGQSVDRRPPLQKLPGCAPQDCAATRPPSESPSPVVLGGFIERLPGEFSRARLWVYTTATGQIGYRDVLLSPETSIANELAYQAAGLIQSREDAPSEAAIPTFCHLEGQRGREMCRPFAPGQCEGLRLSLTRSSTPRVEKARKAFSFIFTGLAGVSLGLLVWQANQNGHPGPACTLRTPGPDEIVIQIADDHCTWRTMNGMITTGVLTAALPVAAALVWPYKREKKR